MTAQFWERKITGGYVFHKQKKKFLQIAGLDVKMPKNEVMDFRYPEEYLPYIKFIDNEGNKLAWEDFECKFPEEGYRLLQHTPCYGHRSMQRAWKIVPHAENFKVKRGTLSQWLSAPLPEHTEAKELFVWTGKHQVFSNHVVAEEVSATRKRIYHMGDEVVALTRYWDKDTDSCKLQFTVFSDKFRKLKDNIWGDMLRDHVRPYEFDKADAYKPKDVKGKPRPADRCASLVETLKHLNNGWTYAETVGRFEDGYYFTYKVVEGRVHLTFALDFDEAFGPEVATICSSQQLLDDWEGILDDDSFSDIVSIFRALVEDNMAGRLGIENEEPVPAPRGAGLEIDRIQFVDDFVFPE